MPGANDVWRRTIRGTPWQVACDERGFTLIEALGFFPIVLLALVLGWQVLLVGYTGILATNAAVEAARAAATREDPFRAAVNASPGFDGRRQITPIANYPCRGGHAPVTFEVALEVPHVTFPFVGSLGAYPRVVRHGTVRCEPPPV
jgi:hypothetical protein